MSDFNDDTSIGLSYDVSIVLPTWTKSQFPSLSTKSARNDHDILKKLFMSNKNDKCPIHLCLDWISQNYNYASTFPSDIQVEYNTEISKLLKVEPPKSKASIVRKFIVLLKNKINSLGSLKTKNNQKNKKKDTLHLNINTNRPSYNSNNEKLILNDIESRVQTYMNNTFKRSYTQDYSESLSSEKVPLDSDKTKIGHQKSKSINSDVSNLNLIKESKSTNSQHSVMPIQGETNKDYNDENFGSEMAKENHIPDLIIEKLRPNIRKISENDSRQRSKQVFYEYIDHFLKTYSYKLRIPADYTSSYQFYIYIYPSRTDSNLLLFQRHELRNLSNRMDSIDVSRLKTDTRADFLFDRRVTMVQNQSNCQITLDKLRVTFINGLPHRLVTIYSSNYENIAKALSIMEEVMPEIMQSSVFKRNLPSLYSRKWSSENIMVGPIRKPYRTDNVVSTWFDRINPYKRFPSFDYFIDSTRNKSHSTKLQNSKSINSVNNNFRSLYKISEKLKDGAVIDCQPHSVSIDKQRTDQFVKYQHAKNIKCPASILQTEIFLDHCFLNILFDKFNCSIIKINKICSNDEQIKLTIIYNSRQDLEGFCQAIGLRINLKL